VADPLAAHEAPHPRREASSGSGAFQIAWLARLSARCREPELELETGRVVGHFDPRPVQTGNSGHQTKSQAVSRRVATLLEAVEALEDLVTLVHGYPGSVVGDRNERGA